MWLATFLLVALAAQRATTQYIPDYVENVYGSSRIVSGWESKPGQHPHQVSIRMVNQFGVVTGCGGNVVHREWLLTAAHCTASRVTLVIRAGVTHLTRPEMMLETTEYYIYPTFDATRPTEVQLNDISLVKLQQPLVYSRNLRPIRVQPSSEAFRNYDGQLVYASGFGRTWTNGAPAQHLMWVYLRGVSNAACADLFTTRFVSQNTICARFFNVTSQSICQGDSGGPLVHVSSDGVPTLVGISSFVAGLPHGCHSGLPGAFIRPGPFHAWFTEITGIDFNNLDEEEITTIAPTTVPSSQPTTITIPSPTTVPTIETTTITIPSPTTVPTTETTTITIPSTTTIKPTSTTVAPPITSTESPDTDEDDDGDDPEISDLLKKLEVKVKVKVKLSKYLKKKKEKSTE